ncbi:hypothetical protein LAZ67_4001735 [Cordylochernes scorpioides]|uniref:Uncharacterized protein n=1 Tax=Cordylochernes scorpioides TaxID=51811 RepID=A0ABY6KFM3_9ARAC|nr:hypothetical protein LAZ67_4001735 [Cordylochernes scorpioides]
MTLNESKSKIMVFRNGGKALTAINATHPILIKSKAKSINLSIKLFDAIVRAVLMYADPLWATEHKDLLDSIQDIFIRRFLNLPRYTPGYIIRLETGRISLSATALKLTLKYWLRVLNMSSDRLPRICFNRTRELSNASGTPIGFIKKLTNLLNNNGSPALVSCDDPETLRNAITGLLKTAADQYIQNDLTRMDKSKLYSHYKDIHISFMTEGYLLGDFPFPVVRLLAQSHNKLKAAIRRAILAITVSRGLLSCMELHLTIYLQRSKRYSAATSDQTQRLCPTNPEETYLEALQYYFPTDWTVPRPAVDWLPTFNQELAFTAAEILRAIRRCGWRKSPGPDRLGVRCLLLSVLHCTNSCRNSSPNVCALDTYQFYGKLDYWFSSPNKTPPHPTY